MLNRTELARFLRTRRNWLRPADIGLPSAGRRRTPGLRRQEVAQFAGVSVDYYIRLEQARGPHPSRQVLTVIARALLLTADEREYLFRHIPDTGQRIIVYCAAPGSATQAAFRRLAAAVPVG